MSNPCKDCEKKGCGVFHDECAAYQLFVKENREISEKRQEDAMYRGYMFYGIRNMKRLRAGNIK